MAKKGKRKFSEQRQCIDWLFEHGIIQDKRTRTNLELGVHLRQSFDYGEDGPPEVTPRELVRLTAGLLPPRVKKPKKRRRPTAEEHVYFVGDKDGQYIKIGYAKDVARRCCSIQNGFPLHLHVFRVIPNAGRRGERRYHKRFKDLRLAGEWFSHKGALADFLQGHKPIPYQNYAAPLDENDGT